jgi:hypothetical protein
MKMSQDLMVSEYLDCLNSYEFGDKEKSLFDTICSEFGVDLFLKRSTLLLVSIIKIENT